MRILKAPGHKTKNAALRRVLEINLEHRPVRHTGLEPCVPVLSDLAVWIEPKLRSASLGVGLSFTPALLIWCLKRAQASHFVEDAFRVQLAFQPLERAIHWFAFSNNDFWHQFTSIPKNSPIPTLGKRNLLRSSTPRQMVWEGPLRPPTKKIQPLYLRHPRNPRVKPYLEASSRLLAWFAWK